MEKKLKTVEEIAEYLRVVPGTVYNWVNKNKIPYLKANGKPLFDLDEINKWIERGRAKVDGWNPEDFKKGQ